jgi:hypothetical protein
MFWPNGARIAVTTSLMFEAGSQDLQKTFGPFPVAQEGDFPDRRTADSTMPQMRASHARSNCSRNPRPLCTSQYIHDGAVQSRP